MKISKAFRLSEEAAAILDKQDNATQYLEDLILARGAYSKADTHIINLLDKIIENMGTPMLSQAQPQISGTPLENKNPKNTIASPTASIEQLKSITGMKMADELEYGDYDGF